MLSTSSCRLRPSDVCWCARRSSVLSLFSHLRSASLLCLFLIAMMSLGSASAAVELPDSGVALGSWADETTRYFGASATYTQADGTSLTVAAPPLRVMTLVDWQNQRRTELVSSWPNQSSVTLWANSDLANSLVSRTRAAALVYKPIWSTEPLPQTAANGKPTQVSVVSAIGADLCSRGEADLLVQGSDGQLYVLNHSAVSPSTPSSSFAPISIVVQSANATAAAVNTALKVPTAPQVSVVSDFLSANPNPEVAEVGVVFVNAEDQLILLSRNAEAVAWPPEYTPHVLVDERQTETQRAVLPFSILSADVNEDCVAELLYAVRDAQQHSYEVFVHNTDTTQGAGTLLLQLSESDSGETYGDSFTLADVNGDGLPELILAVQLANESRSCALADTAGIAEDCTPYHGIRVFYPHRAAGVSGSPTCRASVSSSDHHLAFDFNSSDLFVLTPQWCGAENWASSAALPLYMPSYPSAPLVLRTGDYNRDRFVDLIAPSSYGPLLLTSRAVSDDGLRPFVCTALDSTTGAEAVRKALGTGVSASTVLEAYRTATPFFATLALLGRLEVVLTHHRVYTSSSSTSHVIRVYQNKQVPSRSYFLMAAALTMRSYGASCVGATHHMTWQDIRMRSHWATVTQQGRTQGHALLSPHILVGLDETFSYVHDYTVGLRFGVERSPTTYSRQWPSYLVPNAELFAEVFPCTRPGKWSLELYLPTSRYRVLLVTALAVVLLVIGLPVVWLRCGEMKQDYNEWRMPLM